MRKGSAVRTGRGSRADRIDCDRAIGAEQLRREAAVADKPGTIRDFVKILIKVKRKLLTL